MIDVRIGDSRILIKDLADKSVDCIITSPPYWGLRDYKTEPLIFDGAPKCEHVFNIETEAGDLRFRGVNATVGNNKNPDVNNGNGKGNLCSLCGAWRGQLGLEPTPELFIKHLLDFFDDVRMKLKDIGNCFVNLGDTYAGSGCGTNDYRTEASKSINGIGKNAVLYKTNGISQKYKGIPAKCLCMIPSRFAWGMIERGWILRNEIIWSKPNHMPESVTDRLTKAHEVIYHFVKQQKYYYDLDAIRDPHSDSSMERYTRPLKMGGAKHAGKVGFKIYFGNDWKPEGYSGKFDGANDAESFGSPRARTQRKHQIGNGYRQGMNRDESDISIQRVYEVNQKEIAEFLRKHLKQYINDSIGDSAILDNVFGLHKWRHWIRKDESGASLPSPDDWKLLHEVAPWLPNTFDEIMLTVKEVPQAVAANTKGKNPGDVWSINTSSFSGAHFAVFPLELVRRPILAGCPPNGWVLDPFAGSGTVGEFCRHNNRNAILFDLNPEYKKLQVERAMLNIPELSQWGKQE